MYNNNTREEISFLIIHTNNTYNNTYQFIYLKYFRDFNYRTACFSIKYTNLLQTRNFQSFKFDTIINIRLLKPKIIN